MEHTRSKIRFRLILVVLLVLVSSVLTLWSIHTFFQHEGDIIRRELSGIVQEQDRQTWLKLVGVLETRLKKTGVTFAITKGPYEVLDMTRCSDPELALEDVNELASLHSDRIGISFSLTLGPEFTDAHIDDLVRIPHLKSVDASWASFSDEGFERLSSQLGDGVLVHPTVEDHRSHPVE